MGDERREVGTKCWYKNLKERNNYENICVDWRIILKRILEKQVGGVGWIHLAQDRDQWQAPVSMVINLRVPKCWGSLEWLSNCWLLGKHSVP
jgi:hypothetical protein